MPRRRRIDEGRLILGATAGMWIVELINGLTGRALGSLGILPRTPRGLLGIPLAPWIHGGVEHLAVNTLPFLVLAGLVSIGQRRKLVPLTAFVVLVGGGLVWAFGRDAWHIGASGLICGYFGYLVARGLLVLRFESTLIALVCMLLYGGLIYSVVPANRGISWESHLFGLVAGIVAAWRYRR